MLTLYIWRAQTAELVTRVSLLYFVYLDCLSVRLSNRTTVSVRRHDRRFNPPFHERLIIQHRKTGLMSMCIRTELEFTNSEGIKHGTTEAVITSRIGYSEQ